MEFVHACLSRISLAASPDVRFFALGPSADFSTGCVYRALHSSGCIVPGQDVNWDCFAPLKVKVFFWIMRLQKTRTRACRGGGGQQQLGEELRVNLGNSSRSSSGQVTGTAPPRVPSCTTASSRRPLSRTRLHGNPRLTPTRQKLEPGLAVPRSLWGVSGRRGTGAQLVRL
ncbi:hypothetical protein QYE76_004651 [Lolium multiflorum]|uniref:Reverse transcriptase zinc-binding domain-containing protein n=1 Tax=Lolium multiflorum TaxID=4521 RepID=A0AAD8RR53_LOLMU|nr:hypothetical protein QYE76_004651 [Lolium multiflorum]